MLEIFFNPTVLLFNGIVLFAAMALLSVFFSSQQRIKNWRERIFYPQVENVTYITFWLLLVGFFLTIFSVCQAGILSVTKLIFETIFNY